jgi:hypothetical protein
MVMGNGAAVFTSVAGTILCVDETVTKPCNPGLASLVWSANRHPMNSTIPTHDRAGDEVFADRFRLITDKIEVDSTLLEIPWPISPAGWAMATPPPLASKASAP